MSISHWGPTTQLAVDLSSISGVGDHCGKYWEMTLDQHMMGETSHPSDI